MKEEEIKIIQDLLKTLGELVEAINTIEFDHRCPSESASGMRCRYWRGHDVNGEPHSWVTFSLGWG